ncbi:PAC2 family protein [Mycolicibacterium mucogenicum 261Sha1.1M5]|nr:PAC2 family protein [Mycolicibacterium mucogenicum 261Sha1.1M5]
MTETLFSAVYAERRASVAKGLPLVVALSGSTDAGNAVSQLEQYLWERCKPEEIIRFDTDLLLDYRARRPLITFDEDHFTDYSPEELTLSLARDELGAPFLLLSGFEPDFRWEAFVEAVLLLVHEFEVSITTWVQAIPMPVPHTRPIVATVSGTREDLMERSAWKPTTRLPASIVHLLEYRLHGVGEEVVGFAHLVPHYLANNEYPELLTAALDNVMAATGLLFATDEAKERAHEFRQQVDRQISENEESRDMLDNLERRFDQYVEAHGDRSSSLLGEEGTMPTADQLANELERFLAERQQGPENNDGPAVQ